jgi:hypothetical protein
LATAFKGSFGADAISGEVDIGGRSKRSRTSMTKSKITIPSVDINVTISSDAIHWEMEPTKHSFADNKKSYLEGDVFFEGNGHDGKLLPACEVKWDAERANSSLVVRGSVCVSMDELQIEQVRFVDNLGRAVPLKRLPQPTSSRWTPEVLISFPAAGAKHRLVKQIIRKHLVSQGMEVQGARVEICSAHT